MTKRRPSIAAAMPNIVICKKISFLGTLKSLDNQEKSRKSDDSGDDPLGNFSFPAGFSKNSGIAENFALGGASDCRILRRAG